MAALYKTIDLGNQQDGDHTFEFEVSSDTVVVLTNVQETNWWGDAIVRNESTALKPDGENKRCRVVYNITGSPSGGTPCTLYYVQHVANTPPQGQTIVYPNFGGNIDYGSRTFDNDYYDEYSIPNDVLIVFARVQQTNYYDDSGTGMGYSSVSVALRPDALNKRARFTWSTVWFGDTSRAQPVPSTATYVFYALTQGDHAQLK